MNVTQINSLENHQMKVLKIVFGFGMSDDELLQRSGLDTLEARRNNIMERFARKLLASESFKYLFPERPAEQRRARHSKRYIEKKANNSILHNSPIFYMRRILNTIERQQAAQPDRIISLQGVLDEWR